MKRTLFFPLAALMVVFGMTWVPVTAQAGGGHGYQTRILHTCQHCRKPIYATYRPVRYVNRVAVYNWVPVYHTNCRSSHVVRSSRTVVVTPRVSFSVRRYSPRFYSSSRSTGYRSLRSSPSLRYYRSYGGSSCR